MRLAGAGRPGQQDRCLRAHRHLLDFRDQPVEAGIAGGDAVLQVDLCLLAGVIEALRQLVIARQVQIDQRVMADAARPVARTAGGARLARCG